VAVARKGFAEKYPDLVAKYLRSLNRAVDLYRKEPQSAVKAVAKEFNIPEAEAARQMKKSETVVVGLSGRGDKDVHTVAHALGSNNGNVVEPTPR